MNKSIFERIAFYKKTLWIKMRFYLHILCDYGTYILCIRDLDASDFSFVQRKTIDENAAAWHPFACKCTKYHRWFKWQCLIFP